MNADKLKLTLAVLIVAGGIGGFYYFDDKPALVPVATLLGAVMVSLVFFMQTAVGQSTWEFAKGSRLELRKVVWPARKETLQVTLIVFVMAIVAAVYLWVIDWGLNKVVRSVLG